MRRATALLLFLPAVLLTRHANEATAQQDGIVVVAQTHFIREVRDERRVEVVAVISNTTASDLTDISANVVLRSRGEVLFEDFSAPPLKRTLGPGESTVIATRTDYVLPSLVDSARFYFRYQIGSGNRDYIEPPQPVYIDLYKTERGDTYQAEFTPTESRALHADSRALVLFYRDQRVVWATRLISLFPLGHVAAGDPIFATWSAPLGLSYDSYELHMRARGVPEGKSPVRFAVSDLRWRRENHELFGPRLLIDFRITNETAVAGKPETWVVARRDDGHAIGAGFCIVATEIAPGGEHFCRDVEIPEGWMFSGQLEGIDMVTVHFASDSLYSPAPTPAPLPTKTPFPQYWSSVFAPYAHR